MVEFITIEINRKDLIYDSKVKMTKNSQGVIRIREDLFNEHTYVVFPIHRHNKGSTAIIEVDEIFKRDAYLGNGNFQIDFGREYVGRRCVVFSSSEPIFLELRKMDSIYDGKVKSTWNGQGIIFLKNGYLGNRSYVIFPSNRQETEDSIILSVNEILNKGIHSNNDHSCRVLLGQNHVDDNCLLVLQEG